MAEMFEELPKPPALANAWPSGLAIECGLNSLAVGPAICSDEDLCKQFDITPEQLDGFKKHPAFRAEVREAIAQVRDSNATIKRKSKLALEFYMDEYVPKWIADPQASVDSKTKLLQFLAKIGGFDAAEKAAEASALAEANKASGVGQNNQPQIQIILTQATPQAPMAVVEGSVVSVQ